MAGHTIALRGLSRRAEVRLVSVLPHDFVGGVHGFGQHVKEGAGAHRTEDHAAAVFIGLDAVIHIGRAENLFQPQGVLQLLADVDQHRLFIFEVGCVLLHFHQCKLMSICWFVPLSVLVYWRWPPLARIGIHGWRRSFWIPGRRSGSFGPGRTPRPSLASPAIPGEPIFWRDRRCARRWAKALPPYTKPACWPRCARAWTRRNPRLRRAWAWNRFWPPASWPPATPSTACGRCRSTRAPPKAHGTGSPLTVTPGRCPNRASMAPRLPPWRYLPKTTAGRKRGNSSRISTASRRRSRCTIA